MRAASGEEGFEKGHSEGAASSAPRMKERLRRSAALRKTCVAQTFFDTLYAPASALAVLRCSTPVYFCDCSSAW